MSLHGSAPAIQKECENTITEIGFFQDVMTFEKVHFNTQVFFQIPPANRGHFKNLMPIGSNMLLFLLQMPVRIVLMGLFSGLLTCLNGTAQNCTTPGQNPSTAFPVCGTGVFIQSSVTLCGGRSIPSPKCNPGYDDRNPYYYKFTCFESGTLGFLITPNNSSSDYDWQIFDITGRNPNDIFSNVSLTICSNWSGNPGETGTNATAANLHECGGNTPQYSQWPTLSRGHEYLLMISHFSNTQAGYKLEFKGGTARITDTTLPLLKEVQVGCSGSEFYVKLNKPVKCSSIAADGSDWEFLNSTVPVTSAVGIGCQNGFDTDSIVLTTSSRLPSGTFALRSKRGRDSNTLLDICDNEVAAGQTLVVNILASSATLPDSMKRVFCKPSELQLVMKEAVLCNSIAADGSDFVISGPAAVSVVSAVQANCSNNLVKEIRVQLRRPITLGGSYTVSIKKGSDGNTLLNACNMETPADASASFTAYDSVSPKIDIQVSSSCSADTIRFSNPQANGINYRQWKESGSGITGNGQVFTRVYTSPGIIQVSLEVSNGICTDSGLAVVNISNLRVKANFDLPAFACPGDSIRFVDKSTGPVASWLWDLGNGNTSSNANPPVQFYTSMVPLSRVPVSLVVSSVNGCTDTLTRLISVPDNCFIAVPNAFTPNRDGLNDFLYPLNAWKAKDLLFRVYNRYGQLVWETRDWSQKWDGRTGGVPAPSGSFVWILQYTEADSAKRIVQKGTTLLIR